ncbi:MAG: serine dehydratase subunit alpha family protein [Bacteroidales bacterium]|nr:serine dehydratase subunit alpha family protein [Bacteroidales bacterium]
MTNAEIQDIKSLINREVVLAMGCTEPVAVALAVTKSRETLGVVPDKVEVNLSKNIFKNAMGVGIPGTGMIGLPIAIAMGIVAGDSSRKLEVLDIPSAEVERAKQWLDANKERVVIKIKDTTEKLYVECVCHKGDSSALVAIAGQHTNFVRIEKDSQVLLDNPVQATQATAQVDVHLTMQKVYEFATQTPIEELLFIKETVRYNTAAAEEGAKGYGLCTGKILLDVADGDVVHTTIAKTVAASDARMDGCTKPVYSNSGSGNQGITCTLPIYEYGIQKNIPEETIVRGLILSHLTSIYVKRGIGRLSALCGIVNASIGVAAGFTYLQGGTFEQISFAIKNLINTIAGMVCDGAKPSCALKITTGLYSAFVSSELAINNKVVDATDGIAEPNVDYSIANLGKLGHDGMNDADDMILDIMTNKRI